jgi:hypothetical protein
MEFRFRFEQLKELEHGRMSFDSSKQSGLLFGAIRRLPFTPSARRRPYPSIVYAV